MTPPDIDLGALRARLNGRVATPAEDDFEEIAFDDQWNQLRPSRTAEAVARVRDAAELYLSPKTIELHLGRVYRKLGIRSRAEPATVVAEGRLESEQSDPAPT